LKRRDLILATTVATDDATQLPKLLNGIFGTRFKVVLGYPGGTQMNKAMESGETQGRCGLSWGSFIATHPHWVEKQMVKPLFQVALERHPAMPDVPLLSDSATTDEQKQMLATFVARQVMGRIDLDPASCAFANATVQATRFYTQADDGYRQPWHGAVWLNPPYGKEEGERDSNQARWTRRAIDAYRIGEIEQAIILVNAVPGNVWFSPLWAFPICMVARRIRFYNEETDEGQPTHSNAIIYLGPHLAAFIDVFSAFGPVVGRLGTADHKPLLALEEFTP
jgi:hypothetical protein